MRFAPEETPYPLIAMVPQNITEQLLVDQLRGSGSGFRAIGPGAPDVIDGPGDMSVMGSSG
jgi:hypothetical protein